MKNTLKNILSNPYYVCGTILLISIISLAAAYTAQYVFDLQPCILCLYQRPPYYITGILGMIGILAAGPKPKLSALSVFLAAATFLAGAIIAFYHTGVELGWWASFLEGCTIDFDAMNGGLEALEKAPAVRCDEVPWSDPVLGLSMANYNAIASLGYSIISLVSSVLIVRKANGY